MPVEFTGSLCVGEHSFVECGPNAGSLQGD